MTFQRYDHDDETQRKEGVRPFAFTVCSTVIASGSSLCGARSDSAATNGQKTGDAHPRSSVRMASTSASVLQLSIPTGGHAPASLSTLSFETGYVMGLQPGQMQLLGQYRAIPTWMIYGEDACGRNKRVYLLLVDTIF